MGFKSTIGEYNKLVGIRSTMAGLAATGTGALMTTLVRSSLFTA